MMNKPDVFYKHVGENIRARRKAVGLSQEALAKAVGLKRPSLSNIEKGRQNILLRTFFDIAESLHVSLDALLPERPMTQAANMPDLTSYSKEVRDFVQAAIKPDDKEETDGHQTTQD
jgi:transcriptional regulator with XRE-family HTH domain